MKLKLVLSTATALGLFMGGAFAGSFNELYIDQNGTSNNVISEQSGDNNKIGVLPYWWEDGTARAVQGGNNNTLVIRQSGNYNKGSSRNLGIDQFGSYGYMELNQSGNSNETAGMRQYGSNNDMRIFQKSNFNVVRDALQKRNDDVPGVNKMEVTQDGGNSNSADTLSQVGAANDLRINQYGAGNAIGTASQGVDGAYWTYGAKMAISQNGNNNFVDKAVQQGVNNTAYVTQSGGNNGRSGFSSMVTLDVAGNSGVGQGSLLQSGNGGIMNVYMQANDTSFSFKQAGQSDSLTANVLGDGNDLATNQFNGNNNTMNLFVNGTDNVLGYTQTGSYNTINSTQTGNTNVASLAQSGSYNTSNISQ